MSEIKLLVDPHRRESIHHNPESWQPLNLEQFFPNTEPGLIRHLERFVCDTLEFSEVECGLVGDMIGSASRSVAHDSKRMKQVHTEFKQATADLSLSEDWAIEKVKNGPDVDIKVRPSEQIPYNPLFGETPGDNIGYILLNYARWQATTTAVNQIIEGKTENSEYVCWPISDGVLMKVKRGRVSEYSTRTYCAVEILNNVHIEKGEPKGSALAEVHFGLDPTDLSEDLEERRSGSGVSDYMKMRIRLRSRNGQLLSYKKDIEKVKERAGLPDSGTTNAAIDSRRPGQYLERVVRQVRAESVFSPPDALTMEEALRKAVAPDLLYYYRVVAEMAAENGYFFLNQDCTSEAGQKLASLLTAEYMITGEVDPRWFIMIMANTGLLRLSTFFRENLDVAAYHEWLTSDALNTVRIPNPLTGDARDKVPLPLYMRTMKHVMAERTNQLEAWKRCDNENNSCPTSGLMLLESAIENLPPPRPNSRLTEDVFLKFMLYIFDFSKKNPKYHYQRPKQILFSASYNNIRFNNYRDFFDFMIITINDRLPTDNDEVARRYRNMLRVLRANIDEHQATFNIRSLLPDSKDLWESITDSPDYASTIDFMLLEALFRSGLITRTGGDRAMFTSPQVVNAIWNTANTEPLRVEAIKHLVSEFEVAYDQMPEPEQRTFNNILSRTGVKKNTFLRESAHHLLTPGRYWHGFPTSAAILYYEPPVEHLQGYMLYHLHQIEKMYKSPVAISDTPS